METERTAVYQVKVTEVVLDKIVKYCELEPGCYQKRKVHETDPTDIYREIKQAYLDWKRPEKLYIDFTGGTESGNREGDGTV